MLKRIARRIFKLLIWFVVITVVWVVIYRYVPVPFTPLMAIRTFQAESSYDIKHDWVALDQISEEIQLAVICAEDQRFLEHSGFDYEAIEKAISYNKTGDKIRGASTISQQTAKNVFLWPGRSWLRKGLEAYFTFLIENLWSKERILEVYLNSIEMGDGIYGVEAAANYWFNTKATHLSRHQAAAIASILPNPRKYKASPRTPYLEKRKQWVLTQMNNYGDLNLAKNDSH